MMASRGMGAMSPSKMPKGVRKARRDDTDFTQYAKGGKVKKFNSGGESENDSELVKKARSLIERTEYSEPRPNPATGQYPVMDVSKVRDNVMAQPRYVNLGKDFKGVGGRLVGTKKLDKDSMLQAYIDAEITNDNYRGTKGRASNVGVNFTKNFDKGGKVNAAGNYTKPNLRKRIVAEVKAAATQGTGAGEWSARKAQLVAKKYKKAGGGYRD
jgi:hypothetical protein